VNLGKDYELAVRGLLASRDGYLRVLQRRQEDLALAPAPKHLFALQLMTASLLIHVEAAASVRRGQAPDAEDLKRVDGIFEDLELVSWLT
jgi:hypothetical protein